MINSFNFFPFVSGRRNETPILTPAAITNTKVTGKLVFFIDPNTIGVRVDAIVPIAEEIPRPNPLICAG